MMLSNTKKILLSPYHKTFYTQWQLDKKSCDYNIVFAQQLNGEVDILRFKAAIKRFVGDYALLNSHVELENDHAYWIKNKIIDDLACFEESLTKKRYQFLMQNPFDLEKGPLYRFALIKSCNKYYQLIVVLHHILIHGSSVNFFCDELSRYYNNSSYKKNSSIESQVSKIERLSKNQWKYVNSIEEKSRSFWKQILSGYEILSFKFLKLASSKNNLLSVSEERFSVDGETFLKLSSLVAQYKISYYLFSQCIYAILLHRYTGHQKFCISYPKSIKEGIDFIYGANINTNIMPYCFDQRSTIIDLFSQHKKFIASLKEENINHSYLPISDIVSVSDSALLNVLFARTNLQDKCFDFENINAAIIDNTNIHLPNELPLEQEIHDKGINFRVQYKTGDIDKKLLQNFIACYKNLFLDVLDDLAQHHDDRPLKYISAYHLLSQETYHHIICQSSKIAKVDEALANKTIGQLFEEQAQRTPHNIAVVWHKNSLTYKVLNERANQLASYIKKNNLVAPDTLIALCLDRSDYTLIAILAVLKAGGAYVPIEPNYPQERISYILEDANTNLVLTNRIHKKKLKKIGLNASLKIIAIDEKNFKSRLSSKPTENVTPSIASTHLAYVIYTSGTTGKPKGVLQPHKNVIRLFATTNHWYQFNGRDVWTLFHSYAFDVSVWEMWGALFYGGKLIIPSHDEVRDPCLFYDLCAQNQVTVLNQTPSAFYQFSDVAVNKEKLARLRYIILAGEALNIFRLKFWLEHYGYSQPELINMYGITETTVHATYQRITEKDLNDLSCVGSVFPDLQAYILDACLNPLPIGAIGELYIGGAGLARGYLNQPELTKARFIHNPFVSDSLLYKTGDLMRWLPDGNLAYIGRNDTQVKIRGHRIELGEIEKALLSYRGVKQSIVLAKKHENTQDDSQYLVGYYVADSVFDANAMLNHLYTILPTYMIPAALMHLQHLPLTINGKLDHRALPDPVFSDNARYVPSRDELEYQVCAIWADVLGLAVHQVGIYDDFFSLGGDSIVSMQLVSRLRSRLELEVSSKDIFNYKTIAALSDHVFRKNLKSAAGITNTVGKKNKSSKKMPGVYFANSLQQGFIYHALTQGDFDDSYCVQIMWKYRHSIDLQCLKEAWKYAQKKYPALRLKFVWEEELLQIIDNDGYLDWRYRDFSDEKNSIAQEKKIDRLQQADRKEIYDLKKGHLSRIYIIKQNPTLYTCLFSNHHAILDGWSTALLFKYVHTTYLKLAHKEAIAQIPEKSYEETQTYLSEHKNDHKDFWQRYVAQLEDRIDLSSLLSATQKNIQIHDYKYIKQVSEKECVIENAHYDALKKFTYEEGVTLNAVLQYVWHKILHLYGRSTQTVVGTTVSGRNLPIAHIENSVGLYINTLPLIVNHNQPDKKIIHAIKALQDNIQEINHQFNINLAALQKNGERLFDSLFVYENYPDFADQVQQNALGVHFIKSVEKFDYPLGLVVWEAHKKINIRLKYAEELFDKNRMSDLLSIMQLLLDQIVADAYKPEKNLYYLDPVTYKKIITSWNQTQKLYPLNQTIPELFYEQVACTPDKTALIYEEREMSYRALNEKSNQLAHYLQKTHNIQPDMLIALCLNRNEYMLIAILAILKAGAAYVPIDQHYPQERVHYILKDSKASLVLTDKAYQQKLKSSPRNLALNDEFFQKNLSRYPVDNCVARLLSHHLAYVIYTSGTTGYPKGVMIEHKSIANLKHDLTQKYHLEENSSEIILQLTNYTFDASVEQIVLSLLNGHTLLLVPDKLWLDKDAFYGYLNKRKVTHIHATPTFLEQYDFGLIPSLRRLIAGGEKLTPHCYEKIKLKHVKIINEYGPTETSVTSVVNLEPSLDNGITIGTPIANTKAYVLNEHLTPLPVGVAGELYIAGVSLARGYLNQPVLTAERFIPNVFQTEIEKKQYINDRLYKTGDLVQWLDDGSLVYIGRNDFQVKIRGYRIELGEIETALLSYEGVKQSVVIADENNHHLIGYYVADAKLPEENMRAYLSARLPAYMVPVLLVYLEKLPLTITGKLDRKALPEPLFANSNLYMAPRNDIERKICQIWSELLSIPVDEISVQDDFFRLGGDSIISIQLAGRLQYQLGLQMSVKDLFTYKTIESFSNYLSLKMADKKEIAVKTEQGLLTGEASFLPIQAWFFANQFEKSHHWNQAFVIKTPELDVRKLTDSASLLVNHHDSFRLRYKKTRTDSSYQQYYITPHQTNSESFKILDVRTLDAKEGSQTLNALLQAVLTNWQSAFDLEQGPLHCIGYLYGYADKSARIFVALHHLIVDAISWRLIKEDLCNLYHEKNIGEKGSSYRQWANTVKAYGDSHPGELDYWKAILYKQKRAPCFDETKISQAAVNKISFKLSQQKTQQLLRPVHQAYHTQINDILLTALGCTLFEISGSAENDITLEGHGREEISNDINVARTIGWFTTVYPVRLQVSENLGDSIKTTKEMLRKVPHKGIGYGALIGYTTPELPNIQFNYLGRFAPNTSGDDWHIANEACGVWVHPVNKTKQILDINGWIIDDCLEFKIASKFSIEQTAKIADIFKKKLEDIIDFCLSKNTIEYTSSDFIDVASQADLLKLPLTVSENQYEWFEMTEIQKAYLMGRSGAYEIGNVSNHIYQEYCFEHLDILKFEKVINFLIQNQAVLRTVYSIETLQQRFLRPEEVKRYLIKNNDFSSSALNDKELHLSRNKLSHKVYDPSCFPLFTFEVSQFKNCTILHSSIDLILLDAHARESFQDTIHALYCQENFHINSTAISFKDYQDYCQLLKHSSWHEKDKSYWENKIPDMPLRPELPFKIAPENIQFPKFTHHTLYVEKEIWQKFKEKAQHYNLSYSSVLLGLYGSVIAYFSGYKEFLITITLFNRHAAHEEVDRMWGNCTSTSLFHYVDFGINLIETLKRTHEVMWDDINHALYAGLEVQRKLAQLKNLDIYKSVSPIVFTGFVGQHATQNKDAFFVDGGEIVSKRYVCGQTSQAWIDLQAIESGDQLMSKWIYVADLFEASYIEHLNTLYCDLIKFLSKNSWDEKINLFELPLQDQQVIETANDFNSPVSAGNLFNRYQQTIEKKTLHKYVAVIDIGTAKTYTHQQLLDEGEYLARTIFIKTQKNKRPLIGILSEKGYSQVVGILSIVAAGFGYLPLNIAWPPDRIVEVLDHGNVNILLISKAQFDDALIRNVLVKKYRLVVIEDILKDRDVDALLKTKAANVTLPAVKPSDIAYVIFTSGSTGKPKGVTITHRSVLNTIDAVNTKFCVNEQDRSLALSDLSFDLSVYDIFGLLLAGGAVVFPMQEKSKEPNAILIHKHKITIWNTVPQFANLLVDQADEDKINIASLRLFLLSGDWIPTSLPARIQSHCDKTIVMSLGGATEASIWSIWYEINKVKKEWSSIPYGVAMPNQKMYVLNQHYQHCPVGVLGEIYIGGVGVALNYWQDVEKTKASFIEHAELGKLYKTGDLGKWSLNGYIEYVGRNDFQIKIRGYRVELGEIENVLSAYEGIKQSFILAKGFTSQGRDVLDKHQYMVAYYESEKELSEKNIFNYLFEKLPAYMVPNKLVYFRHFPLTSNGKIDRQKILQISDGYKAKAQDYIYPRTHTEVDLIHIVQKLVDFKHISIFDDFFMLGGNSILAVKLISALKKKFDINIPITDIFKYPILADLAKQLTANRIKEPLDVILPIQAEGTQLPLFLLHPAEGMSAPYNILSYYIDDVPLYGLNSPCFSELHHKISNIEEMASCYIEAIKKIQPKGPYRFCGWSSGGLLAYQLAHCFVGLGDQVESVILFDTYNPLFLPCQTMNTSDSTHAYICKVLHNQGIDPDSDEGKYFYAEMANSEKISKKYRPKALRCNMYLIKAGDDSPEVKHNGWDIFSAINLCTAVVPGKHGRLMDEAYIERVAAELKNALVHPWHQSDHVTQVAALAVGGSTN